jgi:Protein of unknown function (DUF1631).
MLAGCRELALTQMTRALSGMLDRVEDHLFDLAEKSGDRDAQNLYLDARSQARDKRSVIEAAFARHFVELFDRKVRGDAAPPRGNATGELSLVEEEDLEETLAMREMSSKLKASCEGELMALSQRMGFLLERPGLEEDMNPMSPAAICAALKNACDQIEAGQKVRMTLLRQLERYAEDEVQRIYHDLNSHLVERRILPELRAGVPRAVAPTVPRPAKKAPAKAQPSRPGPAAEGDILAALAQLLSPPAPCAADAGGASMASWPTAPGRPRRRPPSRPRS